MMQYMMGGGEMSTMMWSMGLLGLAAVAAIALVIAALVKYVFFR